jgi:hypothetical protein
LHLSRQKVIFPKKPLDISVGLVILYIHVKQQPHKTLKVEAMETHIRIKTAPYKELKILKAALEHGSASETIQFLLDEYANHQQERGERDRPTAKEK